MRNVQRGDLLPHGLGGRGARGGNLGANYWQCSHSQRQGAHLVQQSPQFEEVLVWRCLAAMSSMRSRRNRGVWLLLRLTLQSLHVSAPFGFPSQAGLCLLRFVRVCNGMHHHICTSEHRVAPRSTRGASVQRMSDGAS